MHQIQAFGHAEPLVRVEGYEPPRRPEANRKPARQKAARKDEVTDESPKRRQKREETT
jgi:hypothetical protein